MGFLRSIAKLFSQEPLIVRLSLAPYGVMLALYEGTRLLEHADLMSDKVQTKLPPPLVALVKSQSAAGRQSYLFTLPYTQKLILDLKKYISDKIQLDCAAVENLKQVARPPDFRIHWRYDPTRQCLEPTFSGVDNYLGSGWFHRQQQVWLLSANNSDPIIAWLNRPQIAGAAIFQFVSTILPAGQHANLPLSCDLNIEPNFQLKLTVGKMLKKSLEVQLTANMPALMAKLQYLEGDPLQMISGTTLLPGLRPHLTPQLYNLTRYDEPKKIDGEAILKFLQDEVKPNAAFLSADVAALNTAYPIIDAASLNLVWKLAHEDIGGIGHYMATPWLEAGPLYTQFKSIADEMLRGKRFYQIGNYWLEFTDAYKRRHHNWIDQHIASFQLSTGEIFGINSERFRATGLNAPAIDYQHPSEGSQDPKAYLDSMCLNGVPVVMIGLQKDMPDVLASVCQKLLHQASNAKILWITTKNRLPAIQAALRQIGLPTYSGFPVRVGKSLAGGVYIALPLASLPTNIDWNLFIFHEFDTVALNEDQIRLYSTLKRLWSIVTFEKKQRAEQDRQILQAMQIMQAGDVPLRIFRQAGLKIYQDQDEGWFAKLKSPFKKLFGSDEPTQNDGIPIPRRPEPLTDQPGVEPTKNSPNPGKPPASSLPAQPRNGSANQPIPLPQTTQVFRPTFTLATTVSVAQGSFLEQARRFAEQTETEVVPVPFMEYWPTYAAMNNSQLRWYFFWRTQARQANFLPTDLSYLFLHVYEVLHLIGFSTPQAAFDYLVKFWEHYRILQPKLDSYLMDWLADFIVVYHLPGSPLNWYAKLVQAENRLADPDLAIHVWLHTGSDFMTLNIHTLCDLAGYSPVKNKFYQAHNQGKRLDLAYKQGLQAINNHSRQTLNLSLFDQHKPKMMRAIERTAFANANYDGNKISIKVADIYSWSSSESLAAALQQIIKYIENLLREQAGFKQRLRGIEILPAWAIILNRTFAIPEPRREIKIDLAKVETLKVDSNKIRERLLAEDGSATNGTLATPIPLTSDDNPQSTQNPSSTYTQRPADVPAHLLTDLAGIAAVMGDTITISAKLLRALRAQNWLAQPALLTTVLEDQFLNVVIDEINVRAIEHLGDALLFEEEGEWVAADDYRDEIAYILDHPGYSVAPSLPSTDGNVPKSDAYSDLEVEWASFVQQMQPLHWEGLAALLQGEDVVNRLDAIGRSGYITANQLIDEINTFALNSIGDIVIDTSNDPPAIEMEDIESLRMLMRWALEHVLIRS